MTLADALHELGIDPTATSDEARRAYLRGIKTRKPETDPEGFRRLREAFELVNGALSQSPPAPEPPHEEEEAEPSELAELAARLRGLPGEDQLEERLNLLREGIREHPASAGVRWWLIEELDEAGRYGELLEVMREGTVDGLPGFLENRALQYPESLGPDDLTALETHGHPAVVAAAAQAHLQGSRLDEAAATLGRAIDRLEEVDASTLRPFPLWLPRGILGLEAAGRASKARALQERLWEWLSGTGDSDVIERWGEDRPWMVAHELGLLDSYFPPELRQAAAFSALNGENESATFTAKRFAERDPDEAELASAMLRNLPILHGLYFDVLHRPAPPGRQAQAAKAVKGGSAWTLVKLLPIFLLALIRAFSCNDRDVVVPPSGETPLAGAPALTQEEVFNHAAGAWGLLTSACKPTRPDLPRKACDAAKRAVEKAQAGDCVGAREALDEMRVPLQRLHGPSTAPIALFEKKMQLILAAGCTPPKPPVVPPR